MKRLIKAAVLAASGLLGVAHADAHALLRTANPAPGSVVATAPPMLTLTFSEAVEAAFSRVEILDTHGARIDAGKPQRDPADANRLLVPLGKLAPGRYTVIWHATSVDTHHTQGKFSFTVTPSP